MTTKHLIALLALMALSTVLRQPDQITDAYDTTNDLWMVCVERSDQSDDALCQCDRDYGRDTDPDDCGGPSPIKEK